ncbi:MAG: Ppx/GppA phosphatase family protein [Tumebacillaceae bacterium]
MEPIIGIIDLGSNSARLVLYRRDDNGLFFELDNIKKVLRLSAQITEKGDLDQAGIRQTLEAMRMFKKMCDARQVTEIIGIATAAIRQASNGPDVIRHIEEHTGMRFRVLSGSEEAYYGYLAVVNSMNIRDAYTIDIGGGSTEVTLIQNRQCMQTISFPFGAVSLTRRFFKGRVPTQEELQTLERYLREQFAKAPWLIKRKVPLVAMGGAARNMASIHQKRRKYTFPSYHHYVMNRGEITGIYQAMEQLPVDKVKKIKGLSKDRADIIVAAAKVFHVLLDVTDSREFITSTKGLRDGLLFERILKEREHTPLIEDVTLYSARQLMKRYQIDPTSAEHVSDLTLSLFDQMRDQGLLAGGEEDRKHLRMAALLHDAGLSINVYETHQHTFYLLTNVLLMGLTHRERLTIALIAAYKNDKKLEKQFLQHPDVMGINQIFRIKRLALILHLTRTLDVSMTQQVRRIELVKGMNGYTLRFIGLKKELVEYELIEDVLDQFTKTYQQPFAFVAVEEA